MFITILALQIFDLDFTSKTPGKIVKKNLFMQLEVVSMKMISFFPLKDKVLL